MTQEKLRGAGDGGRAEARGGPPQGTGLPLCMGRGAPEAIGKAKGDALPKASHQEALPATEVAPPTAEHGRAAPMLPDLSQCEDSCAWTKGAYPV